MGKNGKLGIDLTKTHHIHARKFQQKKLSPTMGRQDFNELSLLYICSPPPPLYPNFNDFEFIDPYFFLTESYLLYNNHIPSRIMDFLNGGEFNYNCITLTGNFLPM